MKLLLERNPSFSGRQIQYIKFEVIVSIGFFELAKTICDRRVEFKGIVFTRIKVRAKVVM